MRVVVLGASGNIGTALLEVLVRDPEVSRVVAVARRLPEGEPPDKVTWRRCDIARDDIAPVLREADAVVHLAWLIQPSRRPDHTWQANVVGTSRLLAAMEGSSARQLVTASSVAAYSPGAGHLVGEDWPTHGASAAAYAREKAYVERLLDVFAAENQRIRVARVRPAFTFAHRAAVGQRRLFAGPFLPGSLARPELLPMLPWPRGLQVQVIHASDVARAVHRVIRREATGAFNLAADGVLGSTDISRIFGARVAEVSPRLSRAALAAAWRAHLTPAPPRLFDALLNLPSMRLDRAMGELDWRPRVTPEAAVGSLLRGLQEGIGGETPPLDPDTSGPGRVREVVTGVGGSP
jgi:nucleoside-diphosphate-sugar epimerase